MSSFKIMMMAAGIAIAGAVACGSVKPHEARKDAQVDSGAGEACSTQGATRCVANTHEICLNGFWSTNRICELPEQCDPGLVCAACRPSDGNTCVDNNVHACNSDGTVGELLETCSLGICSGGECVTDCAPGTELVYVVDIEDRLYSFNPANELNLFQLLGTIDCPDVDGSPFSMAVDRGGRAWLLYSSGEMFWVNIASLACEAAPFPPGSEGFDAFGMGFATDTEGGSAETLYIGGSRAAGGPIWLGVIDKTTVNPVPVDTMDCTTIPEFTGTGNALLFGYIPEEPQPRVVEVDKLTGEFVRQWSLPPIGEQMSVLSWAFAHWGGRLFTFTTMTASGGTEPMTVSTVQRLDTQTGLVETVVHDAPNFIVGAGVSTCAPVVVD